MIETVLFDDTASKLAKNLPGIIIAALVLVTILAWNDAIKLAIEQYSANSKRNMKMRVSYAVGLTMFVMLVIVLMLRYLPQ